MTFSNKEIVYGDLSYNWSTETVLLRQPNGRVCAFSASQVEQFGWFDTKLDKQRSFIALSDQVDPRDKRGFYEIYMDGPLAVVRKIRRPRGLFKRSFSHPAYYNDQPQLAQNTDLFCYFVYDAGRLRAFDRFYLDIYEPLMTAYAQKIQQYVDTHNINERSLLGRLVVVDHYNFLVQQDPETASVKAASNAQE
ncbi:hypothetical protein GCM10028825_26750 [Spirosoma agri]